jgi:hypothetical protein
MKQKAKEKKGKNKEEAEPRATAILGTIKVRAETRRFRGILRN